MNEGGRVLIIEAIVGPTNERSWAIVQDLIMLSIVSGMERTEKEYADLLEKAGLRLEHTLPTPTDLSILVGSAA
jgi:hypothetical protein